MNWRILRGQTWLCIACGAVVGSGMTLAAWDDADERADAPCAVEAVSVSPRVVIRMSGQDPVLVAPSVSVRSDSECAVIGETVRVRLDEVQGEMERARERIERARERVERARERVERTRVRLEGLEEVDFGAELEAQLEAEIETRLEAEMARLEEQLQELDRINR